MKLFVALLINFLLPIIAFGQFGCTDPLANNFNPLAQINDGNCTYSSTNYQPNLVANLTQNLNENSALIYWNNQIVTLNDGGNEAALFFLNPNGAVLRKVIVDQASNMDWEALTQDENNIYIGDFGNNYGNRSNLCVYKISKIDISNSINDTVIAFKMNFDYGNQVDFNSALNANNFDCEAFFYHMDSLHLFTKDWLDLKTRHYVLPSHWMDTVHAIQVDSFLIDGLITDATIDTSSTNAMLLGYKNNGNNIYTSFIWILSDYSEHHYFSGNKRRIEIGNMFNVSQTEGITLIDSTQGYLSSEQISSVITISAKLFQFNFQSFISQDGANTPLITNESKLHFYPNPTADKLYFTNKVEAIRLFTIDGKVVLDIEVSEDYIDIKNLNPGIYYLKGNGFIEKFEVH
jgi:hypothetical protein